MITLKLAAQTPRPAISELAASQASRITPSLRRPRMNTRKLVSAVRSPSRIASSRNGQSYWPDVISRDRLARLQGRTLPGTTKGFVKRDRGSVGLRHGSVTGANTGLIVEP